MTPCLCLVQEGQIPDEVQASIRNALSALSERAFGHPAEFSWREVRSGSGFTAAKPSTASIVSLVAHKALSQSERVPLLEEVCDIWMRETNCSIDEVVASINDPAPVTGD